MAEYLQITGSISSAYCQFIDYRQKIEMTAERRSVNNVFWRVVAAGVEGVAGQFDNTVLDRLSFLKLKCR